MVLQIGIPIKLLHEAIGLVVTVELSTGQTFRGRLLEIEDSMNCLLTDVLVTQRDGSTSPLQNVYLRGAQVRFFIVPDNLRYAPMFKTAEATRVGKKQKKGGEGAKGTTLGKRSAQGKKIEGEDAKKPPVQRVQATHSGLA